MPWAQAREEARRLGEQSAWAAGRVVALEDALGAVLARDLTALVGVPAYDAAAMDGYAVAGSGPEWSVMGRVLAGASGAAGAVARLRPGQAVEIATGAEVPEGTDAVLPYESVVGSASRRVRGEIALGKHVRRAGEDTVAGDSVLPVGTVVTPAVVGLAASLGHDTLAVRRPRVAAFVTGDEITASGRPGAGQVRDAIGPMLPGIAAWAGAETAGAPRFLRDGFDAMVAALRSAEHRGRTVGASGSRAARVGAAPPAAPPAEAPPEDGTRVHRQEAAGADVVVVCGASSKGPADHLRAALAEVGAAIVVDGVACRPGHPQLLARLGTDEEPGPLVVGLPGNPNAALAAAATLLMPALRAMAGGPDPDPVLPPAMQVKGAIRPHAHDTRLVAVRISGGQAEPVGFDRPGSLRGAALADAYAVVPPGWSGPYAALLWLPR
ncbi:molybdopterin molybdotransferase MoeA [Streptomonospora litoralis]|nr:molybdopterin molybdotransferase MoeA [Streptomonospora litoralis]